MNQSCGRHSQAMRYSKYFILLLPLYATLSYVRCIPEVNTTTAHIKGSAIKYGKKTVNQFLGIPFAEPPVGDLRFKKTVPLQGWSGELNAVHTPPACSQYYRFDYEVIDKLPGKSENCLYLNIWVPGDACEKNLKAVMFWLFAGSFTTGSNRLPIYNGTVLAAKGDVIVVTPNYRLGIFGFLSTDSEKAPGNMEKTADELVTAVNSIMETSLISFLPIYNDQFLPETPSKAYENGKTHDVCVLIGDPQDLGTFQLVSDNADVFGPYGEKDPTVNKTYGSQLIDKVLRSDNIDSNGRSKIIDYYLSNVSDTDYYGIRHQVARAIGDVNTFCNDYYYASQFSKRVAVYVYYFVHRTHSTKFANWTGVTLFSELLYPLGAPINDPKFTREEAQLSDKMVHLWSNFVKDGVPSLSWKKFVGSDTRPYVQILQVKGDVNDNPYQRFKNCNFLKPYISNYGTD